MSEQPSVTEDHVRQTVIRVLQQVVKPSARHAGIGGSTALAELGLRSLDLAEAIALLEMEFDYDPFIAGATLAQVKTIDDLASLYRR